MKDRKLYNPCDVYPFVAKYYIIVSFWYIIVLICDNIWRGAVELASRTSVKTTPGYKIIKDSNYHFDGEDGEDYKEYRIEFNRRAIEQDESEFPIHIDLELTNKCNLKCPYCFRQKEGFSIEEGFMSQGILEKVADEARRFCVKSVKLNWRGEPTLHPHIVEYIAYIREVINPIDIMINTNGNCSKEKLQAMIEAGLTDISFSVDAFSSDTYNVVRAGGNYERVKENIMYVLHKIKKERLENPPNLRVTFVYSKFNAHEWKPFYDYWKSRVNMIAQNKCHKYSEEDFGVTARYRKRKFSCPHPFTRILITWDGDLVFCCGDWEKKLRLGNIDDHSIYDVFHSKSSRWLRDKFRTDTYRTVGVCKNCEQAFEREPENEI